MSSLYAVFCFFFTARTHRWGSIEFPVLISAVARLAVFISSRSLITAEPAAFYARALVYKRPKPDYVETTTRCFACIGRLLLSRGWDETLAECSCDNA